MTSPASVTLVTPVYNQAAFLGRAIDSVLAQTWPHIDYRVIDDGSTDAAHQVLDRYAGRLSRERQANQGQAATLNRGWRGADSRYLAYLSADDVLAPDAVARMVRTLEADPALMCAYPDSDLIDARGRTLARGVCGGFDLERLVVEGVNPIGPGAVFRAEAFHELGGWRTDVVLGADDDFWMRMAALGPLRFVRERLAGYRVHRGSLSRASRNAERAPDILRVLADYFAQSDVPLAIRAREAEAWANAHRGIARRLQRAGRLAAAWRHRRIAASYAVPTRVGAAPPLATRLRVFRALTG